MAKIPLSNYTQVPNLLLESMDKFTHTEFKVIMFICRYTFGFQREKSRFSWTYLENGCGLSRQSVVNCLQTLAAKGWLVRTSGDKGFEYSLDFTPAEPEKAAEGVQNLDPLGTKFIPEGVQNLDLRNKGDKQSTETKDGKFAAGVVPEIPSKCDFEEYLESECVNLINLRPNLFQELLDRNWKHLGQPIRDWRAFVKSLSDKIIENGR